MNKLVFVVMLLPLMLRAQSNTKAKSTVVLAVHLAYHRMEPSALKLNAGRYIFRVSRGVAMADVDYVLVRNPSGSAPVEEKRAKVALRKSRNLIDVDLRPGAYVLMVPGVPEWRCTIDVSSK